MACGSAILRPMSGLYRERPPPASLADVVLAAWSFTSPPDRPLDHVIPPDGCVSVVQTAVGLVVVGPRTSPLRQVLPPGARVDGLRLWPDATAAVLGVPARPLVGVVAPLAVVAPQARVVWPSGGAWTLEPDRARLDPGVRAALAAVVRSGGNARLPEVAAEAGWSVRHLERRFGEAVGLSVKAYARIVRLRRTLVAGVLEAGAPTWARHAFDAGYADQAHLVREAVALTGLTPRALGRYFGTLGHDGVVEATDDASRRMGTMAESSKTDARTAS